VSQRATRKRRQSDDGTRALPPRRGAGEEAYKHLGQGEDRLPAAQAWAALARVHATLAHTAATAINDDSFMNIRGWNEVAGQQPRR
jgi:hypothetical protein